MAGKESRGRGQEGSIFHDCMTCIHITVHKYYLSHSQMEHYFFSYLLTWEVDLIEILEIMAQMWQYVIFLSLKPTKVTSDFILY